MVFPTFFNLSLNLAIRSSWSEPQSAPGLVFADCIELYKAHDLVSSSCKWKKKTGGGEPQTNKRLKRNTRIV